MKYHFILGYEIIFSTFVIDMNNTIINTTVITIVIQRR